MQKPECKMQCGKKMFKTQYVRGNVFDVMCNIQCERLDVIQKKISL